MDFGRLARLFNFSSWNLRASTTPTFPLRANLWLRTNFASIWNKRKAIKQCNQNGFFYLANNRLGWAKHKESKVHLHPRLIRESCAVAAWYRCGEPCGLQKTTTHKITNKFGQMEMKSCQLIFQNYEILSHSWCAWHFMVKLTLIVICMVLWLGHFCISTL